MISVLNGQGCPITFIRLLPPKSAEQGANPAGQNIPNQHETFPVTCYAAIRT